MCHNHPAYCIQQWHQQWHPAPSNGILYHTAPSNGTLHHVQSVKMCHKHPQPIASSNGTQQRHLTMAPSNGTKSSLSKCVITTPHLLHPAMAPSNHTWPCLAIPSNGHVQSVKVCHNHPAYCIQQWHPAMAPYHMPPSNGTTSNLSKCVVTTPPRLLYPAMAPSTQQWHLNKWHPAMAPAPRPVCQNLL